MIPITTDTVLLIRSEKDLSLKDVQQMLKKEGKVYFCAWRESEIYNWNGEIVGYRRELLGEN